MGKNANISNGTLPIRIEKNKTIVKRTASKVIKMPKVIGNIKEIKANKVMKRPKIIGNTEEPKANRAMRGGGG